MNYCFLRIYFPTFISLFLKTEPTGSRYDYEQYRNSENKRKTPMLRTVYPVISHKETITDQWDVGRKLKIKWFRKPKINDHLHISE